MRYLVNVLFLVIFFLGACQNVKDINPKPTIIRGSEDGGELEGDSEGGSQEYFRFTRSMALGPDWERITHENFENAAREKTELLNFRGLPPPSPVDGYWVEKGAANIAGNTPGVYYYPPTDEVFALSSSGTLYSGGLDGSNWKVLNDDINFVSNILCVTAASGNKRILTSKADDQMYYSDNNGIDWQMSNGIQLTFGAGIFRRLIKTQNDDLYLLQNSNSNHLLYKSEDNGTSWFIVHVFNGRPNGKVDIASPFGTDEVFIFDNGETLYKITEKDDDIVLVGTMTGTTPQSNVDFAVSKESNGSYQFYVLEGKSKMLKSSTGLQWNFSSTLETNAWGVGILANQWQPETVYFGAVEFYKSDNYGGTFSKQNFWWEYYDALDLLHADMVGFGSFQKPDGTKFILIGNHGGIHYMPEPFLGTHNITKEGLYNAEYYDVITVRDVIFAGSQDQGGQRFISSGGVQKGKQMISGDYVELNTSDKGQRYWQEYPYGAFQYYHSPLTEDSPMAYTDVYGSGGSNIQLWAVPSCNFGDPNSNAILVGGGTPEEGESGSFLIRLSINANLEIIKYKYPKNFLDEGGYITAIGHSPVDTKYMYIGLNTGQFFYSRDGGQTWTKTQNFSGPNSGFLLGTYIECSKKNKNLVYYAGGSGNVFRSTDGGVTFTSIRNGMPNTYINELALNETEDILFAATDAGPFWFKTNIGKWNTLMTPNAPIKRYSAVEYLPKEKIVRFATYGRGVWDYVLKQPVLPEKYFLNSLVESEIRSSKDIRQTGIYPNPIRTNQSVFIDAEEQSVFRLFDGNGKLVYQSLTTIGNNEFTLKGLKAGVYIYQIKNQYGSNLKTGKLTILW